MRRIGVALVLLTTAFVAHHGCEEATQSVSETGFEVRFAALERVEVERIVGQSVQVDTIEIEQPALTFAVWVFVDGEYQGRASTDDPRFYAFPAGTFELYMRSNMRKVTEDTFYSWGREFTVDEGSITYMTFYTDTIFRGL